jgi:DNA-binding MarR family transcriptional regulator
MKSQMSLTPRQRATLEKLIDLYREAREPIHYTLVAQRLGVRSTTAYEMLKLLEREGYVQSEYVLASNAGPGRSSVVFKPTRRADAAFRLLARGIDGDAEWETVKQQILSRLGQGQVVEQALLDELLSRLQETEPPLVFCAETLTALFLNLSREARHRLHQHVLIRQLLAADPNARNILNLLPGFALGLALPEQVQRLSEKFVHYSELCQARLQQLDEAKRAALADFMCQILGTMHDLTGAEGSERPAAARHGRDV